MTEHYIKLGYCKKRLCLGSALFPYSVSSSPLEVTLVLHRVFIRPLPVPPEVNMRTGLLLPVHTREKQAKTDSRYKMDITEVSTSQDGKGKKGKKAKKKSAEVDGEGSAGEEKKMVKSELAVAFPPAFSVSEIKNKQRRHFMFMKLKQEKRKVPILGHGW